MIYLIGGAPRVGKSTLAKIIFEKNQIPYIPADLLRNTLYHYLDKKLGDWDERSGFFFPYFSDFLKRANKMYPNGCVIEGDIFMPAQIAQLDKSWIRCIFLGTSHVTLEHIRDEAPNNWVNKVDATLHDEILKLVLDKSELFKTEAHKHGFAYFDIHPDWDAALEEAHRCLLGDVIHPTNG